MRVYVLTTGLVFALITFAHLLRVLAEGPHLLAEPLWVLLTAATAALSIWAWRLLRLKA
jgi:hypothetical protein